MQRTEPVVICDGGKLTDDQWLAWRLPAEERKEKLPREFDQYADPMSDRYIPFTIGGSATAAIMGVSPWMTATELYDKMTGTKPKVDFSFNEEGKVAGHVFEPFVALNFLRWMKKYMPDVKFTLEKDIFRDIRPYLGDFIEKKSAVLVDPWLDKIYEKMTEKWGINPNAMFQCGDRDANGKLLYPWAVANIDGLVEVKLKNGKKKRAIWEAKTTSSRNVECIKRWQDGIVPPYYMTQIQYYMKILNVDCAYITCSWGFSLDDMAVIKVDRDDEFIDKMFTAISDFVDMIETGCSPDPLSEDQELLASYYVRKFGTPKSSVAPVELPANCEETVIRARILDEEVKAAERKLADLKKQAAGIYNQLLPIYGEAEYGQFRLSDTQVVGIKLVTPMKRSGFDEEGFKKLYPEIYKECLGKPKLNLTLLGKRYAKEKSEFVIPAEVNPDSAVGPSYKLTIKDVPVLPT